MFGFLGVYSVYNIPTNENFIRILGPIRGLHKKATCGIDRARRVLPAAIVGFVEVSLETNRHELYSNWSIFFGVF
jgi:hypothetical protein